VGLDIGTRITQTNTDKETNPPDYTLRFTTLLKKGHFHRQDAKSAKIFKQECKNVHLYNAALRKEFNLILNFLAFFAPLR